jgi:hypothetical protein
MNTTTTKIAGEAMTDDEKIALAAKFGIGPYSGLSFARALLASNPAVLQKPYGWVGAGNYWTADELTAKQVSIRTDTPMVPVYVATTAPAQSCGGAEQAAYSAPFTTDVPHCCGDPDTCNDPCDLRAAEQADEAVTDATERMKALWGVLMCQVVETSSESYLSLRCVGMPPTDDEFALAVNRAIDAARAKDSK